MDPIVIDDLARSGLVPEDMGVRLAGPPEFTAAKVPVTSKGYVIPYYNINGGRLPFYRLRLFNFTIEGKPVKYKQLFGTSNHIYFPSNFQEAFNTYTKDHKPMVLLTEGEKKAAALCKAGFPCVAVGGVDSWRNRSVYLPADTVLEKTYKGNDKNGFLKIKLPSGHETFDESAMALGMKDLIDFILQKKASLVIVYDTDLPEGVKFEVQRAVSALAFELVHQGLKTSNIRQLILPFFNNQKTGLDDYLKSAGKAPLQQLLTHIMDASNAFPKHPNARAVISQKLQRKLGRKETQEIAMSIIADLDANGRRFRAKGDGSPYYFNDKTLSLMSARLLDRGGEPLHESEFGTFLYREYGLSSADGKILTWLAAQFTGEEPVTIVEPSRIISLCGENMDEVAVQISDSHFAVVSSNEKVPVRIMTNGSYGLLFEQGHVEPTDPKALLTTFQAMNAGEFKPWWHEVISNHVNLTGGDTAQRLATALYYISPFLMRWKGTQLPIEITIGEPGSGKSSLYGLRLGILTGNPKLRNVPDDLRDWYASITNAGGVHVIDNLNFTDKNLRQRMSDELCRLVTEPKPTIELRRLYTTSAQNTLPVNTIFAFTALTQPFYNNDVMQRAAIFEMAAVGHNHNANWVEDRMAQYGGRMFWLAHQLHALHKFLALAKKEWNPEFRASHRLANYEQALALMMKVCNLDNVSVGQELVGRMQKSMVDGDWTLDAIKEYVEIGIGKHPEGFTFTAQDLSMWAEAHEEHHTNIQLTNGRSLGRYLTSHITMLYSMFQLKKGPMKGNRQAYQVPGKEGYGPSKSVARDLAPKMTPSKKS